MHYGFVRALDTIDFSVSQGEVVGILGDNGAGKSTLMKIMSGAHRPQAARCACTATRSTSTRRATRRRPGSRWSTRTSRSSSHSTSRPTSTSVARSCARAPSGWIGFVDRKAQRKRSEAELDQLGVRTAAMTPSRRDALRRAAPGRRAGPQRHPGLGGAQGCPAARRADGGAGLRADQERRGAHHADGRAGHRRSSWSRTTCPLATQVCDRLVVLNRGRRWPTSHRGRRTTTSSSAGSRGLAPPCSADGRRPDRAAAPGHCASTLVGGRRARRHGGPGAVLVAAATARRHRRRTGSSPTTGTTPASSSRPAVLRRGAGLRPLAPARPAPGSRCGQTWARATGASRSPSRAGCSSEATGRRTGSGCCEAARPEKGSRPAYWLRSDVRRRPASAGRGSTPRRSGSTRCSSTGNAWATSSSPRATRSTRGACSTSRTTSRTCSGRDATSWRCCWRTAGTAGRSVCRGRRTSSGPTSRCGCSWRSHSGEALDDCWRERTDAWRTTPSHVTAADLIGGQHEDRRLVDADVHAAGFDDGSWSAATRP